ncbi:phosphoesterase [Longibacter salinarum]|uniref:Phosphoesterase n=1 Tax=Longibacter salinarum TaxID=1850348 RepID=A0A2A8D310_9BACT|nr:PHP domain-containing protein [Longibacter salinarum]PEN15339.1 phosphoesterase [Longibacter salinarum]
MRRIFADLHTHTHRSDGVLSPTALIEKAAERGLKVVAITDHDTIAGLEEGRVAAEKHGLELLPGVELTVTISDNVVHLLGYAFDPSNDRLRTYLDAFSDGRRGRMQAMIDRLQDQGVTVTLDEVEDEAGPTAALGRPHLARILCRKGHAEGMQEAFDCYIGNDAPAYVAAPGRPAREAVDVIHEAGGFVSIAHPGQWMSGHVMRNLQRAGVDAIECISPSHPDYLVDYYKTKVQSSGLLMTGGSDYHGGSERRDERLGRLGLSEREWRPIARRWRGDGR